MAITAQTGTAIASNASASSLTTAAVTWNANGRIVLIVSIADQTKSVSSVTNSVSAATWSLVTSYNVPSGPRIEWWECTNITSGSKTVTVTLSGSASLAIAVEQYGGDVGIVSGSGTPTATGSSTNARSQIATAYQGDWQVAGVGFLGASGDTITADTGTKRQAVVGTDGTAAAIFDNGGINLGVTLVCGATLNNSRTWGTISRDLQGSTTTAATLKVNAIPGANQGNIAGTFPAVYRGGVNLPSSGQPVWPAFSMANGTVGVAYAQSWDLSPAISPTTYSLLSGSLPPGLSLSNISGDQGEITGTPTTTGTYSFTLRATNSLGTADKAFSIVIGTAVSGGSYTFAA